MANPFTTAQAPVAMQMIAPDLSAQQTQLLRQQQMADMLRKQAMEPNGGTQVINGWAVKQSPMEGVNKIVQALAGGYMQRDADSKQADLAKALSAKMGAAFDSMSGAPSPAATPSSAATPPVQPSDGTEAPETAGAPAATTPSMPQAAPQDDQIARIRNQARAAFLMGNTELANKLLENISTMTNEQRNMLAMGQDPKLMGELGIAEARKKGMMELQPGTTTVDLATGQERFQPKVGEGITLANGQAAPIPGYAAANAEINGANAGAISAAQAGNKMITVNTPNGPVMMTEAQAVQQAAGNPQSVPSGLDLSKLTPQQQAALAQQDPTAFANGVADFQRTSAQAQSKPAAVGIPLQNEGSSAFQREINQKGAQNLLDSRDKARSANDELSSIYESRNAIAQGVYQGAGADMKTDAVKIANGLGIPIDSAKASNTDYLRSTLGKGMLDNAKKLGVNPTDADARRLDVIIGTIGKDPKAMDKLLDWREAQAQKVIKQHNADIESAMQGGEKFPFDLRVTPNVYTPPVNQSAPASAGGFSIRKLP
jgi:hypothetical protein